MRLVIVTGMSGAGKATTLKILEDSGYYCVDNLPINFIDNFAEIAQQANSHYDKVAIGIDIRSVNYGLEQIEEVFFRMAAKRIPYEILFLDANDETLIKRYKETRRIHPLAGNGRVGEGIQDERRRINFLKDNSTYVLDTSTMLVRDLKQQIDAIFVNDATFNNFFVTVLSFGFKYGIPVDSDLVFDVRFLANPFYVPELKAKTGLDDEVHDYVMETQEAQDFLVKLVDMIKFLIPNYIKEGKNSLVISIGCTGGKHRSVTLARELFNALSDENYGVKIDHRDIRR